MSDEALVGFRVRLYISNLHHVLEGTVITYDDDEIILNTPDGMLIVERAGVAGILVFNDDYKNTDEDLEPESRSGYDIGVVMSQEEDPGIVQIESNDVGHGNQYGSIIPADMLIGENPDPQVDLSISAGSLRENILINKIKRERDDSNEKV